VKRGPLRRAAWISSALIHLLLVVALLMVPLGVPQPPPDYFPVSLVEQPVSAPAQEQPPEAPPAPSAPTSGGPAGQAAGERERVDVSGLGNVGVQTVPEWVSGPPPVPLPELDTGALARSNASRPIREALAGGGYHPLGDPSATVVDTLLWAQDRLEWLAEQAMEAARAAPQDRGILEPAPRPGSMQEMRGEPMMPLLGLAAVGAQVLADLGIDAWNRLIGRDPDAVEPPEMDLTYPEVIAFAGLHDHRGLSIFEWYGRLSEDFRGGLGDLQRLAASLSDKRLVRLDASGEAFVYRRIVHLQDVVDYYVAFLNRLPPGRTERRETLERILATLVREPSL